MKKLFSTFICILIIASAGKTNAQNFVNYTTGNSGLPDDYISGGVAIDTNNIKWFGTSKGVAKYNDSNWAVYDTSDGIIDMYINCIAVDKNNNVWVGTEYGVSKFDGISWISYDTTDGLIDNSVKYIAGDINGDVWFATYFGVSRYDGTTWTDFTAANGLPIDAVSYIAVDSLGNKWFATLGGGLAKYNNTVFDTLDMSDSLVDDNVMAIAIDHHMNIWAVTFYGMSQFDDQNDWVANYDTTDGLYNNYLRDIKIDSKGNVWMGMFADYNQQGGISKYTGSDCYSFSVPEGLVNQQVIGLAIDKNDIVWIATGLGVSKLTDFSGIRKTAEQASFSVYPTITSNQIQITPDENSGNYQIEVFNSAGQFYYKNTVSGTQKIDVSEFPDGCYFVRLISSDKINVTKIMVLR
jgi:ligand-binding sensor domain-containing protein